MSDVRTLCDFLWACPSPFHCAHEIARRLGAAGFAEVDEREAPRPFRAGDGGYVVRGGSVVAWRMGQEPPAAAGFRIAGAHTDSPNLRLKPRADAGTEALRQLAVEVYGSAIVATWTDRDLGLSGRVMVRGERGPEARLFRTDLPVARIPNLAIHLNRDVNEKGLLLDAQKHLPPVVAQGTWDSPGFGGWLSSEVGAEVLAWDLGLHDVMAPAAGGLDGAFVFSARLDDQFACHAVLDALLGIAAGRATEVAAFLDHEEIGSGSARGARGPFVRDVLARLVRDAVEQAPGGLERAVACSWMASVDMAHAAHPNWADKHEPGHKPRMNGGPVLKTQTEQRYATDAEGAARFRAACAEAGVPCQDYAHRTDLPCGTTIGPLVAAGLGVRTVDVGCAMLSMHSIREQCGAHDAPLMAAALRRWLQD